MAVGIVATIKIQAGKNAEFEGAFKALQDAVRANEPGNKFYELYKNPAEPTTYVVMEKYADQVAMEAHGKSDHFRKLGAALGPCLAGAPQVQRLEFVS